MAETLRNQYPLRSMRELSRLLDNARCADCLTLDPDWASINLGIFICIKCAGIHRNLGVHHSKVRSVDLDTSCWDPERIEFMQEWGNKVASLFYEANAPRFYVRPGDAPESAIVRENWIRAKYVRRAFVPTDEKTNNASLFCMPEPVRFGFLTKQGGTSAKDGKWQKRWCVLHQRFFHWYRQADDSYPAKFLDISGCEVHVTPPVAGQAHGNYAFQITTRDRTLPVIADSAEEMFAWVHAIRRASIFYHQKGEVAVPDYRGELKQTCIVGTERLARCRLQGWLQKQGGKHKSWHRRYFCVVDNTMYYAKKQPQDTDGVLKAEGGIPLEDANINDNSEHQTSKPHCFSVVIHDRTYFLTGTSGLEDCQNWIRQLRQITSEFTQTEEFNFHLLAPPTLDLSHRSRPQPS